MFARPVVQLLVVIGILAGMSLGNVCGETQTSTHLGRVNGIVKDSHDAAVGRAIILFESRVNGKKFKQKAESNGDGVFEVELPAGSYRVTVKFSGFHDFKREGLIIESAKPLIFDIVLRENPRKIPAITE